MQCRWAHAVNSTFLRIYSAPAYLCRSRPSLPHRRLSTMWWGHWMVPLPKALRPDISNTSNNPSLPRISCVADAIVIWFAQSLDCFRRLLHRCVKLITVLEIFSYDHQFQSSFFSTCAELMSSMLLLSKWVYVHNTDTVATFGPKILARNVLTNSIT